VNYRLRIANSPADAKESPHPIEQAARQAATTQAAWNEWYGAGVKNHLRAHLHPGGILPHVLSNVVGVARRELREDYEQ
jgi:hypothetical protein